MSTIKFFPMESAFARKTVSIAERVSVFRADVDTPDFPRLEREFFSLFVILLFRAKSF